MAIKSIDLEGDLYVVKGDAYSSLKDATDKLSNLFVPELKWASDVGANRYSLNVKKNDEFLTPLIDFTESIFQGMLVERACAFSIQGTNTTSFKTWQN